MLFNPLQFSRLSWLLLFYVALGLVYSVVVPLGESPDEGDHFLYIQHLAQTGKFPELKANPEENFTLEANQPPLFYLVNAVLLSPIPMAESADFPKNVCYSFAPADLGRQHFYLHDTAEQYPYRGTYLAFHLARLFSVFMGAGTVWLTYLLGCQITPGNGRLGLLAAALLALNPQFIFITASVNNDALTTFLGAAILVLSVHLATTSKTWVAFGLGVCLGAGFLTKFALFAFWPLAILAAVWPIIAGYWQERRSIHWRLSLAHLLLILGIPVLVAGWWYWRTYLLYGDPLAWGLHLQAKWTLVRTEPFTWRDLGQFIQVHFQSYWALFGWLSVQAPGWVYGLLAILCFLASGGLVLVGRDWWRRVKLLSFRQLSPSHLSVPLLFNGLAVLVIYLSLWRYIQTINWSGYQGRLAYAAAAPITVFMALGLRKLEDVFKVASHFSLGISGGMALFALGSLLFLIAPAYPRPVIYQPAPEVNRICARFASGLMLEGYELPERLPPGEETAVTLYGYGMTDAPAPQQLLVQVVNPDGRLVGQASSEISWQAGEVVSVTLKLPISADAPPARSVFIAGLQNSDGTWQTATSTTGRVLDLTVGWQTVKVEPIRPFLPTPQYPVTASFGDQLALIGYDRVSQNETTTLTLYWQATAPMTQDYTTFVHVLNAQGELLLQADSQPHNGIYPTSVWDAGEIVADVKTVQIPADGVYQLAVGVYQLATLERLPVYDGEGRLQEGDNLLFLPEEIGD